MTRTRLLLFVLLVAILFTSLLIAHPGAADSPYQLSGPPVAGGR